MPAATRVIEAIPSLSKDTEKVLTDLFADAANRRHEVVTVEHLLFAITDEQSARETIEACGASVDELRSDLTKYLDERTPRALAESSEGPDPTLGFQRVLQRAVMHVQSTTSGRGEVTGARILVAIFGEKDSDAVRLLHQRGVTRLDAVNFIAHGIRKSDLPTAPPTDTERLVRFSLNQLRTALGALSSPTEAVLPKHQEVKPKLFISYAHVDIAALDRLLVHLKPLERANTLVCWSDRRLRTGDKWREELLRNLEDAVIAILLVSADFLASDFIAGDELPPLLVKAESKGLRILPVILKPCGFRRDPILSTFQAANDPTSPLLGMSMIEQEALYDKIAEEVANEIRIRRPGASN